MGDSECTYQYYDNNNNTSGQICKNGHDTEPPVGTHMAPQPLFVCKQDYEISRSNPNYATVTLFSKSLNVLGSKEKNVTYHCTKFLVIIVFVQNVVYQSHILTHYISVIQETLPSGDCLNKSRFMCF